MDPEQLQQLRDLMPFARTLGVRLVAASPESVTAELDWRPDLTTAGGRLHGGAVMALADSGAAVCAYLNLPPGAGTTTVTSTTHFHRGVGEGRVRAVTTMVKQGRSIASTLTEIRDGEDRLVATVLQTHQVLT